MKDQCKGDSLGEVGCRREDIRRRSKPKHKRACRLVRVTERNLERVNKAKFGVEVGNKEKVFGKLQAN